MIHRILIGNFVRLHYRLIALSRYLSTSAKSFNDFSESDQSVARDWLAKFNSNTISQKLGEITFSRSSGPGGQNVNKYVFVYEDE